ncbi:hypothetical protein KC19_11G052300 [Ceratodon purpureus]|uniref:Secreted protein n=1 Tax=Ceratodon purpureus TaxID=3225 RepID=A0A8T0GE76_CERPU|nr:hypothetical protein KC19_11G052300 [Ceratodon purpureus]
MIVILKLLTGPLCTSLNALGRNACNEVLIGRFYKYFFLGNIKNHYSCIPVFDTAILKITMFCNLF